MKNTHSKIKIFIVEDEYILAEDIKYRLVHMGYEVVGMAATALDALKKIAANSTIDIILLDITIRGDLDGIELATLIKSKYNIPFIFLTSNTDKDIVERAKKTNPYAYILKPFNDHQISIALDLALANYFTTNPNNIDNIEKIESNTNNPKKISDSLFLKKHNCYERVLLEDILFLQASSNYCNIITNFYEFIYSSVLKRIELQLPKNLFLRVHRSYVINITKVTGFEGNIIFINDKKIPVSKNYKNDVFKLFNTI